MLLTVDIGNTQIALGLFEEDKLLFVSRMATQPDNTRDQYAVAIKNLLGLYGYGKNDITGAAVSSVVPAVGYNLSRAIAFLCCVSPIVVSSGTETGMTLRIDDPTQLGTDMIAGAVAAKAKYPLPAAIFDFGTATKVSVLDSDGAFLGCAITAGIHMSIEALSKHTAVLPSIVARVQDRVIGTNTVDSMRSGLLFGSASFIDGMSERIETELGQPVTVIVTGGASPLLQGQTLRPAFFDSTLLLDGLRRIFEMNQIIITTTTTNPER